MNKQQMIEMLELRIDCVGQRTENRSYEGLLAISTAILALEKLKEEKESSEVK